MGFMRKGERRYIDGELGILDNHPKMHVADFLVMCIELWPPITQLSITFLHLLELCVWCVCVFVFGGVFPRFSGFKAAGRN